MRGDNCQASWNESFLKIPTILGNVASYNIARSSGNQSAFLVFGPRRGKITQAALFSAEFSWQTGFVAHSDWIFHKVASNQLARRESCGAFQLKVTNNQEHL